LDPTNDNDGNGDGTGAPATYSLALKGDGMTVDRKIDEATALNVLSLVMGGSASTFPVSGSTEIRRQVPRPTRGGKQSLREYLDAVEAKRNPDKIVTIAKFISDETGKNFTRKDVKARFQDAAEPVPGNYGRDFQWTVRNGWIAPASNARGEFYVTDAGAKAIAAKFSAEIKQKTGVSKGRRGAKRRRQRATRSE
jgi:hypothetical protein